MKSSVRLSGGGANTALADLSALLIDEKPAVVAIASAFVSTAGVSKLALRLAKAGNPKIRIVAGIDHFITHPKALSMAVEIGWELRLGTSTAGIFHPKLLIGGSGFTKSGGIREVSCLYVGSSNLTAAGLERSLECGFFQGSGECGPSGSDAFSQIWSSARPATVAMLRSYAATFAEASRIRTVAELRTLGIADSDEKDKLDKNLFTRQVPLSPTISDQYAAAAWAGLQTFTGEYQFQLEFPRAAGRVISNLIVKRGDSKGRIDVYCPADQLTRSMQYGFYQSNGMFRLNIPNDVPGVEWARQNRSGIVLVERGPVGGAPLRVTLFRPGVEADEIVDRSTALNTWGRTATRAFGWY